uniref:Uncharacterized protein n=1 Tax=Arundo donax TaxID=35708 RepID=A0A0A8XWH3_ARUDO
MWVESLAVPSVTSDLSSPSRRTGRGFSHLLICLSNPASSSPTCRCLAPGSSSQGNQR